MIYLKQFHLPDICDEEYENDTPHEYPYGIFPYKGIEDISFAQITIFYGNNGSGKSTLLNIITETMALQRSSVFRSGKQFKRYVGENCRYIMESDDEGLTQNIPPGSKLIASEDIFDYILSIRGENQKIDKRKELQEAEYFNAKYSPIRFDSLDDYDRLKSQNAARRQSKSDFVIDRAGRNIEQFSNGETALSYFNEQFVPGRLYLLDEPENSLSPKFQSKLSGLIRDCARYCDCQFIIASHSPFILSLEDALVYDLDAAPAQTKDWHELENMKVYYDFFDAYKERFSK